MIIRRLSFLVAMIFVWGSLSLSAAQDDTFTASVEPVQGLIQLQISGESDWQTISDVALVNEGDRIRSDGEGVAYLTFFDGAEVEIGPNSLIVVSTLAEQDSGTAVTFDVLVGSALTNIDVALDAADRFEVHAPAASAVVRGTHWWTLVDRDGNAIFLALDGDVEVIPHQDGASSFVLDLNSAVQVLGDGSVVPVPDFVPPTFPTDQIVAPDTCGDGVCAEGESELCALDCATPPTSCGNGICDPNEDLVLCGADCGPVPPTSCGNGTCDPNESDLTCAQDCEEGSYFGPARPPLCGNGTCDATESNLTCPGDCRPLQSEACMITADNINLRSGPGTEFPIVDVMHGELLPALGQNNGWIAVQYVGNPAWVAARLVSLIGPCDDLPFYQAPSAPTNPNGAGGGWGACGSCDSCGYPASECQQSPDGLCVWNPALCRPAAPPSGPVAGSLSVSPCNITCVASANLVATFTPPDGSTTIASQSANTSATWLVLSTVPTGPNQFEVVISCFGASLPAYPVVINMTDTNGDSVFADLYGRGTVGISQRSKRSGASKFGRPVSFVVALEQPYTCDCIHMSIIDHNSSHTVY